ncbi:hypothetical protein [Catellatospora citrea]|uniref:Uncharacterized protein n=1 Tax=Catellatospora citrea TaxID=53366 RepID=A0A8J3KJD2_9ACTN|nr:hypothetical protein [Catellatospora citrea]RKE00410.1 hypothetical protein C8E86_8282 [Catellatospora citrea]GIF98070.1 hypothetical protein Cci01nite_31640 [Catellatospora citrea]
MVTEQFMVVLTKVRPLRPGDPPRDEQNWPEDRREVVMAADLEAAHRILSGFCALPQVRAGRQRAKIVPLGGSDNWVIDWSAPPVAMAIAGLVGGSR